MNEDKGKVEFERLINNGRANSSHSNIVKDLQVSTTQQSFQNSQEENEEDRNSQKVFIFDTGNHSDRHGFIQVDRKKKNVLPQVSKKLKVEKTSFKIQKPTKRVTKNSDANSQTKLVADSNWSYGLKNGLKNSNRLIWVATSTSQPRIIPSFKSEPPFEPPVTSDKINNSNVTHQKEVEEVAKKAKVVRKHKQPNVKEQPKFVLFTNHNPPTASSTQGIKIKA